MTKVRSPAPIPAHRPSTPSTSPAPAKASGQGQRPAQAPDDFVARPPRLTGSAPPVTGASPPPPATAPTRPALSGPPVVVVMDGAIDDEHPALMRSLWVNHGEVAGDGLDNDGNGVADDVHGFNAGLGGGDVSAGSSLDHGTHVAGIVVAQDDRAGVRGVAAGKALVMGVGGMYEGEDLLGNFERAVDYVVDMKARGANVRVVNASFGGRFEDPKAQARWKAAAEKLAAADILFCVSTENGGGSNLNGKPDMPGNLGMPNQITVTAMDQANDRLARFASYGDQVVQIAARGENVRSTVAGGAVRSMSGTSMATPAVAGAAALAFAMNPSLSAAQVRDLILRSAQRDADLRGKVSTGGKLNVGALMAAVKRTLPPPAPARALGGEVKVGDGADWFRQLAAAA